jgi:hypothetical protein
MLVARIALFSLAVSVVVPSAAARSAKVTPYTYDKHDFGFDVGFRAGVQICEGGQMDAAFAASFLADVQRIAEGQHVKELTIITWWCGIHGVLMSADIRAAKPSTFYAGMQLVHEIATLPYVQYAEPDGAGEPDIGLLMQSSPGYGTAAGPHTRDAAASGTLRTSWGSVKAYYR